MNTLQQNFLKEIKKVYKEMKIVYIDDIVYTMIPFRGNIPDEWKPLFKIFPDGVGGCNNFFMSFAQIERNRNE